MTTQNQTPRRTTEQWQTLVDQQIQSGLSGAAFCKSEGIQYQSFMNWRLKLSRTNEVLSAEPDFIELTTPDVSHDGNPSDWLVELDIAPGVQLRIAR